MFNKKSLIKEVTYHWGKATARSLTGFFNALSLPLPEKKEFYATRYGAYIVFLDDLGLLLRATHNWSYPLTRHPAILQPVFSRNVGGLRVSLLPGIHHTKNESMAGRLKARLFRENIKFYDSHAKNIGLLPTTAGGISDTAVIIDDDSYGKRHINVKIERSMKGSLQQALYNALACEFQEAWPADKKKPDRKKIAGGWENCAAMKQKGTLITGWQKTDEELDGIEKLREAAFRTKYHLDSGALYKNRLRNAPVMKALNL